jgi:hypothetical protein
MALMKSWSSVQGTGKGTFKHSSGFIRFLFSEHSTFRYGFLGGFASVEIDTGLEETTLENILSICSLADSGLGEL